MKKRVTKYILDFFMTIGIVLLMNLSFTGIAIHELLGIAIVVVFVIHNLLNSQWIRAVGRNFFKKKSNHKMKIYFILDIILLVDTLCILITGLLISQIVTPFISNHIANIMILSQLHHLFSYTFLILISIHIGLHWKAIMNVLRNSMSLKKDSFARTWCCRIGYIIIAIFGILSMAKTQFFNNFKIDTTTKKFDDTKIDSSNSIKTSTIDTQKSPTATFLVNMDTQEIPTIKEYLGNMNCTGCGKHCSLLSPRCNKGVQQAEIATQKYNETYDITQGENSNNEETTKSSMKHGSSPLSTIAIMGFYIGATHYIVKFIEKKKNTK